MDTLSDVLGLLRPRGGAFMDAWFSAPWAVSSMVDLDVCAPNLVGHEQVIAYHYVLEGSLRVRSGSSTRVTVSAKEAILLPRNELHILSSDHHLPPIAASEIVRVDPQTGLASIKHGGGGSSCHVICGFIAHRAVRHPLIDTLPSLLKVNLDMTPAGQLMEALTRYASSELPRGVPGAQAVLASLSELLLTEALRQHLLAENTAPKGWWLALRDPLVERALHRIHSEPGRPWTIDGLAKATNSSRSKLAERFTRLVGEPVFTYLTRWRMELAALRLRETRHTIFDIANDLGYSSEASFARAFARHFGSSPARWRRSQMSASKPPA